MGIQGSRIDIIEGVELWTRRISPVIDDRYSYAVAFVNSEENEAQSSAIEISSLNLINPNGYMLMVCTIIIISYHNIIIELK